MWLLVLELADGQRQRGKAKAAKDKKEKKLLLLLLLLDRINGLDGGSPTRKLGRWLCLVSHLHTYVSSRDKETWHKTSCKHIDLCYLLANRAHILLINNPQKEIAVARFSFDAGKRDFSYQKIEVCFALLPLWRPLFFSFFADLTTYSNYRIAKKGSAKARSE